MSIEQETERTEALKENCSDPLRINQCQPQTHRKQTVRVAIYARYSTDGQKETSIDDQVRACRETAARLGLADAEFVVYADDAITGAQKGTHKREQYHAMRESVKRGEVDVLICDQQCRLARHAMESLSFFDDIKKHDVQLLTADGFDSRHPTAQLLFGLKSVFSEFFVEETQHRVRRGMEGEFERGAMITAIPYGYDIDAEASTASGKCLWKIVTEEAEVVREVFRRRKEGMSFPQIAAVLNSRGVPTPRHSDEKSRRYWRAGGVWRIIQNPIYKGVYVVNFGKSTSGNRLNATRRMPELEIVSESDWAICQSKGKRSECGAAEHIANTGRKKGPYGGGRHAFAGVFRCGTCGVHLSCHHANSVKGPGSLHCIQCEHATAEGVPGRQPLYVSILGIKHMLRTLLTQIVQGEVLEHFRDRLKARLSGGRDAELAVAREELRKAANVRSRLTRLLSEIGDDDSELEAEYVAARERVAALEHRVQEIERVQAMLNRDAIENQLSVDISVVVDAFLADEVAPEKTRALLQRIFPRFVLVGKSDRFTAIFAVQIKPGAILAEASGTEEVSTEAVVKYIRLRTSGAKYPTWSVEEITASEAGLEDRPVSHFA